MNAIASKLPEGFHIGINFSASHIISPTFVDECLNYRDSFTRRDLNLVLEVTEREPLNVDESLVQRLNILHENGFVIALDDFGTGCFLICMTCILIISKLITVSLAA